MIIVLCFVTLNFTLTGFFSLITNDLPATEELAVLLDPENGALLEPTKIYDRTGNVLLDTIEISGSERKFLSINPENDDHFSPQLVQVTIAILDPNFWDHSGISWKNFFSRSPHTIAERLVDEVLLENEPYGLIHSIRMRLLAAQVVSEYGKTNVLEWYLNSAYYGHMAYGAQAASKLYLDKSASELNLNESCLLTMLNLTPTLNPIDSPLAAKEIKQAALDKLYTDNIISKQDYQNASREDVTFKNNNDEPKTPSFTFSNLVIEQLSSTIGKKTIERGGLSIITTIDHDLQEQTACVVNSQLTRLSAYSDNANQNMNSDCEASRLLPSLPPEDLNLPVDINASVIIMDLNTSEILAILGDTDVNGDSGLIKKHQPGSMLTPFIAAASFTRGMSPSTLVWDVPINKTEEIDDKVQNTEQYHGPQRLRLAIANNYTAAMQMILDHIGSDNIAHLIEPFGINELQLTDSIEEFIFNSGSVNIIEMAQAYSIFGTLGTQTGINWSSNGVLYPNIVLDVKDYSGTSIYTQNDIIKKQVLSKELSYLVHHILADDTARWPSLGYPNPLEIAKPSAGLAGFTDNKQDIWTVGYTPKLITTTWLGVLPDNDQTETIPLDEEMAAGIWHALIQYGSNDTLLSDWQQPEGITTIRVCDPSGMLPSKSCPTTVNEVFLIGNEPTQVDTLYSEYKVNKETGLLATVFTPLELVIEKSYMDVPEYALDWAEQNGINTPPQKYDLIRPPQPSPNVNITEPEIYSYVHGRVDIKGTAAGDIFSSYTLQIGQGLNPQAWLQLIEEENSPVTDNILGNWETTHDGLYAVRLIVLSDNNNIESDIIQVTVDNTPPTVKIIYPQENQTITSSSSEGIPITVNTEDAIGIQSVSIYIDNSLVKKKNNKPFIFTWIPTKGSHQLFTEVQDLAGNSSKSEIITFTIN